MRSDGWFRFDTAKVGFCGQRGAVAETLHGAEPKAGAATLQGWDFARGGAQKARFAGDESGFLGGNEVERRGERTRRTGCVFRMREERPRRSAIGARRGGESVELCEVGDEQQGGEGVEVEGAVVTEGEDDDGGAIEGGEGGEGGVEHSGEVD